MDAGTRRLLHRGHQLCWDLAWRPDGKQFAIAGQEPVLLVGFTQEAANASKLLPGYEVHILGNYWFRNNFV